MGESKKISFHFHPYDWEDKRHAVEKAVGGVKRKYLCGISSGIKRDLHGEKMTEKCIKSFQEQANSGDILLYEGQHGVNFVDDIGRLAHAEILPSGDWYTEYMLHDVVDGFEPNSITMEKVNKLWKQVNGMAPYTKPRQKGFSIEGEVPDGGILNLNSSGQRIMDDVLLDGVVVVPRPAYKDSIASAVYKALNEVPPEVSMKIHKDLQQRLQERVRQNQSVDNFYQQKYLIEEELESAITDIICGDVHGTSREKLEILFQEYSDLMINLILQNEGFFGDTIVDDNVVVYCDKSRMRILKQLESAMLLMHTRKFGGIKDGQRN